MEAFSGVVSDYEIHNAWHLGLRWVGGGWQIEMPTLSNSTYTVLIRSKPSLSTLTAPVQKLGKFKHQRTPRLPGRRSIVNVCLHERGEGLTW